MAMKNNDEPSITTGDWGRYIFLFFACGGLFILIPLLIKSFINSKNLHSELSIAFLIIFYFLGMYVALISATSLIIDQNGISKILLRTQFRKIKWDDIQEINSSPFDTRYGVNRYFRILVKNKPTWLGIKILSKDLDRLDEVISTLNFYIEKHNIKVRWADALMTDLKDYKELRQLPPPPYGDDKS